jgi:hypothetical protein
MSVAHLPVDIPPLGQYVNKDWLTKIAQLDGIVGLGEG